jgi:hypothetical protein
MNYKKTISRAQSQLAQLETAIESFKAKQGTYPPGNGWTPADNLLRFSAATNQLYYELTGAQAAGASFTSATRELISTATINAFFNVGGFMNASPDAGEIKNYFLSVSPADLANINTVAAPVRVFIFPAKGPRNLKDADGRIVSPWCYDTSSTNRVNLNSYDLWVDLILRGKTNRICNWSRTPLIVY